MKLLKFIIEKMRYTGKDWLDHTINAILLCGLLRVLFAWLMDDSESEVILATCFTMAACILLEVLQAALKFGNAQTSDLFSGIVPAIAFMIIEWSAAIIFKLYPVPGNNLWANAFVLFVILPIVWYVMVYKQLKKKL